MITGTFFINNYFNGQIPLVKKLWGLIKMTLGLVHASYS